jgi:hypothetical protein
VSKYPGLLYRYELRENDSSLVDGALFAYARYEIEAQRMRNEVRWHYAAARLTDREAWVKYNGKEVWRAAAGSKGIFDGVSTARYGVFFVKTIPREVDGK